ncbi:UDP-3-O-(3-hydroxymyristoyl)glucosamine N-acyltransferase [Notoacmeibacter sp. MSK16QG-6]|uniref:UDP-3-O-(3-hydroxymyristoyl)glucosamine N-acyltransferase n=1 Tax=Notoacmeibacter sp. MSK16QG-6 TaxID=2957982 RepID=UPI0020A134D0|nr:UDP-3-O-(3-hydroxymyristoyl)glucosamine N-acyltransferase [Notoacmeibacter sp. MSK16QG-6]MCP1199344.1 UDP-3-O-(3-hydroxymyristoyl)glucosamine N-acyltransferase [Notoacmeibacter sp. MSK16QG-6]
MFFSSDAYLTLSEIAELTGAELDLNGADASLRVEGLSSLASARPGHLTLVTAPRYVPQLEGVRAAAVLLPTELKDKAPEGTAVLTHDHPQSAFAAVAARLYPQAVTPSPVAGERGVSAQASVDPTAELEDGATVEPFAVIGAGVRIGAASVIAPHAVIGKNVTIGRGCFIGTGVTVQYAHLGDGVIVHAGSRIGQDGFGYVPGPRGLQKVPQIGRVIIQDGVELGANVTVDRGALDDTVIGAGTKIDNQVQVAHNVQIGQACAIAAQTGLSGSVSIGDGVLIGGQVGFADHLKVGSRAQIAAKAGVMNDIPAGERWAGAPAMPARQFFRLTAAIQRLARPGERKKGKDKT